jgi:hypothetical protein
MDLASDAAAIKRTVAQNVYQRNIFNWVTGGDSWFTMLVKTADELLNRPGPSTRMIDFKPTVEESFMMGGLPGRMVGFSADVDGRETDGLLYSFAHHNQWQYTLIGAVGAPPRQCFLEISWIQSHLSFK